MSEFESAFEEALAQPARKTGGDGKSYVVVPDGEYTVVFKGAEVETKEGYSPTIKPKFYFPQLNQTETAFIRADKYGGMALGKMVSRLGLKPRNPTIEEAVLVLNQANGWTLKIKKETKEYDKKDGSKGQDRRYYVNSVVARAAVTSAPPLGTDTPFDDNSVGF